MKKKTFNLIINTAIYLIIVRTSFANFRNSNATADAVEQNSEQVTTINSEGGEVSLAQCLTEKEVIMYGTEWCSHCKNQKAMFGESV